MAYKILEDCINCHACESECPNDAISQSETIFVIDSNLCTECLGYHDEPQCVSVCPIDCVVQISENQEVNTELIHA